MSTLIEAKDIAINFIDISVRHIPDVIYVQMSFKDNYVQYVLFKKTLGLTLGDLYCFHKKCWL